MRYGFVVVPNEGADVTFHIEGEVTRTLTMPGGVYATQRFLALCAEGEEVDFGDMQVAVPPPRYGLVDFGDQQYQSAANPSYRVTNGMRLARDMDEKLRRTEAAAAMVQRGVEALNRAQAAPPPAPVLALNAPSDDKPADGADTVSAV